MALDPQSFKAVMGQWPSGVTVVTTVDADGPAGMTASSFSSVSLDPPLVSICIARHLPTHARLSKAGVFAVNILSKNQVQDGLRFAGQLREVGDRFQGIATTTAATGAPLLPGTLGWVDCRVWAMHAGGDHTIFVGEVLDAGIDRTAAPLLYHSRAWGQFADVLAREATLARAGAERDATVIANAFGADPARPDPVDAIVARVQETMAGAPVRLLLLDDAAGAADPLLVRQVIQSIAGLVGRSAVGLRPRAGPMALANVLVALKSGVRQLSASPGAAGPYVAEQDLRTMLARMGVAVREE
jgi:flavin reductase (DIM6/NTAB) family NADH-FMN oxidoreductase RutF